MSIVHDRQRPEFVIAINRNMHLGLFESESLFSHDMGLGMAETQGVIAVFKFTDLQYSRNA